MTKQFKIIFSSLIALSLLFGTLAFVCAMTGCKTTWEANLEPIDYKNGPQFMPKAKVGLSGSF